MPLHLTKLIKICTMTKKYDIIWLDEVESTNKYVQKHIDSLDNLSVVSVLSQTAGRGQGDHKWHSQSGQNLLFSILLKQPDIPANRQSEISDAVAYSIVKLLERHGIEAWIKPPNDIWVGTKKICGILIEHSLRSGRISWSIIGIGLNVNQTVFPEDLPNPTSMALENQGGDLNEILLEILEIFSSSSLLK